MSGSQKAAKATQMLKANVGSLLTEYINQNRRSEKAYQRALKGLPGGTTRAVLESDPFPLVAKSAEGPNLTSIDGKTYIDFVSDFTAGLFGHSNKVIQDAIIGAVTNGFSLGAVTELEAQLSESIKQRFPSIDLVRYCNSGTEANTYAIAAGLAFTGRKKVMVFDRGYHGGTLNFSTPANPMNIPHNYVFGTYDEIAETQSVLSAEVGVILIEPMQSSGGMRPASQEFLEYLRTAADALGAVLIFDEVVTSRLDYHGLQGRLGIRPDLTTLGKFHGGGLPFGAFGGRREIMEQFDPKSTSPIKLHHSGTFNNNIFTMTAAVAAVRVFTKEEVDRINVLGEKLRDGINEIILEAGLERSLIAVGVGSCVGIGFLSAAADDLRDAFYFHHLNRGLWFGRRGFACLNFAHQESRIEKALRSTKDFAQQYRQIILDIESPETKL
ncbi:aminotransferase class-iii [Colletotrichum truncatum]|uniref:Aminotransferase class-iii n=1 Tax=Colletotrichum truncatum TaxID=5467 RepID=A0ACC3ZKA7_COLTU|nr:aminotransferase class-iii [Colletotrichum truncatum]KAF6799936.1 aminotransferase class-iii [Colletotrichum truncatum]